MADDPRFEMRAPSVYNAFELFGPHWISHVPGIGIGKLPLFEDGHLAWFERTAGFGGKKVLELGALEGAHTYMMSVLGAADITAIEMNKDAYLRCLVVKEALNIRARFLLGNFVTYLLAGPPRVDLILASGMMYHLPDPLQIIEAMCRTADTVCCWTHVYDQTVIERLETVRPRFPHGPHAVEFRGRRIQLARQEYLASFDDQGFCGGTATHSVWLTRQGFVDAFDSCGFDLQFAPPEPDHPHGPAVTFVARRRQAGFASARLIE